MERYEDEDGRYVLYVDGVRAGTSDRIAMLIDTERDRVVTHGDPGSVRREHDALLALDPQGAAAWLLIEGRPGIAAVNRALTGSVDIHDLHLSCTQSTARRLAGDLIARLRHRRLT